MVALPILSPAGDEGDGPAAGHQGAEAQHEPRAAEPGRTDGKRQRKRSRGDEVSAIAPDIGALASERELAQHRAERVFPDAERFVQLGLRDDERHEHADAIRVDP